MMTANVNKIPNQGKSMKKANRNSTIAGYAILGILSLIWLYPIVWILLSSIRTETNDQGVLIGTVVSIFLLVLGFDNFVNLFNNTLFPQWFLNTLIVSVSTFVLSLLSYVMSKLKKVLKYSLILGLFVVLFNLLFNLIQTYMINFSSGSGLGFYVKKFFDIIPKFLLESARLDGTTNFQIFLRLFCSK